MTIALSTQTNERLVEDWARLCSSHDLHGLMRLFTEDAVYEDVALGVVSRGKEAVRAFANDFFSSLPDVTLELSSKFATPSWGGTEWVMRATHTAELAGLPATGKRFELRGASILEFADGRISRVSDYWDRVNLREQLD